MNQLNSYSCLGKVIRTTYKLAEDLGTKANMFEVTLSVLTNELKKEGEYYPTILVKFTVWANFADALSQIVEKDMNVVVHGQLGTPQTYEDREGVTKVVLVLHSISTCNPVNLQRSSSNQSNNVKPASNVNANTKAKAPSTNKTVPKSKQASSSLEDDDEFDFFN